MIFNNPELRFEQFKNYDSISPDAITSLHNWATGLIREFELAVIDLREKKEREYPTLQQWGIQLPSYNYEVGLLRLPNEHIPFVSVLNDYFKLAKGQHLLQIFRKPFKTA